jgi:hypothetical protein
VGYNGLVGWTKIRVFPSRLEAEAVGNALENQGIPVLMKGDDLGIFGPGHSWATPQGVSLWVPTEHLEEVRELLSCLFPPPEVPEDA